MPHIEPRRLGVVLGDVSALNTLFRLGVVEEGNV